MPSSSKKTVSTTLKTKPKTMTAKKRTSSNNKRKAQKKRRAEASSDEMSSDEESTRRRKKAKSSPGSDNVAASKPNSDDEIQLVESGSGNDEDDDGGPELESDGLEDQHRLTIGEAVVSKKDMAQDVLLIFSDRIAVKFTTDGNAKTLIGRWCGVCKSNEEFIKKNGRAKAFFTGGNSSCRYHIRQHYDLYKERCKNADILEHHWAIPRPIWKKMQALKNGKKVDKQANLDGIVLKARGPREFTRDGLRDIVTQFITCDDQSLAVANKATFRNCLVAMRPRSTRHDLPTTHDVLNNLHNKFVQWLQDMSADIEAAPGLISTTADGWSVDTTKASFLGVTAHWIEVKNGKWKLRSEVIGFQPVSGEHSGGNLGRYFVGVCERVRIINAGRSKLLTATLDNTSNNTTLCDAVEALHHRRKLQWDSKENQLPCLAHVVNLGNVDVMAHITKLAAVETTTAIWEYDPSLPDNRMLNGSLDVIAAIRTLAIKIQSSGQRIELFHKLQIECGITNPLKIPLHSNVRWGTAYNMLSRSYALRQSINLFIATADQRYGPITTIRRDGRIVKHIPWTAFSMSEAEWARAKEVADILADSNRIQQYFSAEKQPTLWRALPAIEELQTAWETKRTKQSFALYHDALEDGLNKIKKYYTRFDEKPAYIIALALHPYYKLAYIELAWGGAKEQEAERRAGNPHAKNWQDEACKILERIIEKYWKTRPSAASKGCNPSPAVVVENNDSIASEFDRHRLTLVSDEQEEGWQAEIRRYLKDLPANVTKDTDVVEWWQDNGSQFPTFRRVALDFLPCQASSVACERLFSSGGEIATKRRAQLGAKRFEELQIMKFAWRDDNIDIAASNSAEVEEIDDSVRVYEDLLAADEEQGEWDQIEDEISSW